MNTPNWQHHSRKDAKPKWKPRKLQSARYSLKVWRAKYQASKKPRHDRGTVVCAVTISQ